MKTLKQMIDDMTWYSDVIKTKAILKRMVSDFIADAPIDLKTYARRAGQWVEIQISGGGTTNLSYTPSPTNGLVASDSGTDATIPLADNVNAGLITSAEKVKISNITVTTPIDLDVIQNSLDLKENLSNKATTLTASDILYPSNDAVIAGLNAKENTIVAGTTTQYRRGDNSWQTLVKGQYQNNTQALAGGLVQDDIYRLPITNDIQPLAIVFETTFNFDVTSTDWTDIIDQTTFETFLTNQGATNIIITDFSLLNGTLKCNLTCDNLSELSLNDRNIIDVNALNILGIRYLYLSSNQIVTFNPTIALPSALQYLVLNSNQIVTFNPTIALPTGLQYLYLGNNQIVTFNPTIALPSALQYLYLNGNQMTTQGYTNSEVWANAQPSFTNLCQMQFFNNLNSVAGTNLRTILISKNCNVQ